MIQNHQSSFKTEVHTSRNFENVHNINLPSEDDLELTHQLHEYIENDGNVDIKHLSQPKFNQPKKGKMNEKMQPHRRRVIYQ